MGLTRRRFVARAGLAAVALGGFPRLAGAQAPPVGRIVRRAVALGPGGVGDSQLYATNRRFLDETDTPWVRLWADWPVLQPEPDLSPDRGSGAAALARLDAGVDGARADGRHVIVTAWRFPSWASGSDDTFAVPAALSPGSEWGRWIDFLLTRYGGRIDALELVNEPNLQLTLPPGGEGAAAAGGAAGAAPGATTAADAVARMFVTAQAVAAGHIAAPLLVGPATSDRDGVETFTADLLDALDARGFTPGPRFAWSHHAYTDVENELTGTANRTAAVRAALKQRWAGWPTGDPADPGILITETGARLDKVAELYGLTRDQARQRQAELLDRHWTRMQFGPEGEGVGLVCQYLFVTDRHYDCGLCDLDGTPRPAYRAWARLPAFS